MKKFIQAAFHITPFQILLLVGLGAFKYWVNSTGQAEVLKMPLIITAFGAFFLLISALLISNAIENKGHTPQSWADQRPLSRFRRFVVQFVVFGQLFPLGLGYGLLLYLFTPTTFWMLIALLTGIVFHNCIDFLTAKRNTNADAST